MGWTKEERAEYNKWYREHNRERMNEQKRAWYQRNKERLKAKQKEYREQHKKSFNDSQTRWREKNRKFLKIIKNHKGVKKNGQQIKHHARTAHRIGKGRTAQVQVRMAQEKQGQG